MPDDPGLQEAMELMQMAMNTLTPNEKQAVVDIRREVDEAASVAGGQEFDKRLEFCYAVKFSKDKVKSLRLQRAVEAYIKAVEGD